MGETEERLQDLIKKAQKCGADAADAILLDATSLSVEWRQGQIQTVDRSEGGDLGLRVFVGHKQAMVSTSDRRDATVDEIVARAVAMAREAPEDSFCGLADPEEICRAWPVLDMADTAELSVDDLVLQAKLAESAAMGVDGVTQIEKVSASLGASSITLAASNGFCGSYRRTGYSLMAGALAGTGTAMERDYDYATAIYYADLPDAALIGRRAGERAVRKCGARKVPTSVVPVVFDPRVSNSLLSHFASAVNGASIARGTSFLLHDMGKPIFPEGITIVDDPFRRRGLRSKAFDAEGLLPVKRNIIEKGVLTTWFMDLRSARQLGLKSTSHASRGVGSSPSPAPTNLYIEAGVKSVAELIKDIAQGFYVTDLMGMGVNGVTGDYSRAACGFWIENGEITFAVNEVTIAGNLKDMFAKLEVADDLAFKFGVDAPTVRIDGMTIAGL